MAGSPLIVTVCLRQSVNSMREDDVNVPDCTAPVVLVTAIDIDPPSAHGKVMVRDRPSGETVIAVFIAAWLTVAATMLCVVEVPGPDGSGHQWGRRGWSLTPAASQEAEGDEECAGRTCAHRRHFTPTRSNMHCTRRSRNRAGAVRSGKSK